MSSVAESFSATTPTWKQLTGGACAIVLAFVLVPAAFMLLAGVLPVLPFALPLLAYAISAEPRENAAPPASRPVLTLPRAPRHAHGAI